MPRAKVKVKTDWKAGDKAFYVHDFGASFEHVTVGANGAWRLGDGSWVVAIDGKSGGYAAERFYELRVDAELGAALLRERKAARLRS